MHSSLNHDEARERERDTHLSRIAMCSVLCEQGELDLSSLARVKRPSRFYHYLFYDMSKMSRPLGYSALPRSVILKPQKCYAECV